MNCKFCKKEIISLYGKAYGIKRVFCSRECMGKFWRKKGRSIAKNGYVLLRVWEDEFFGNNTVYEHRFVVTHFLKRKLNRDEDIHHINGNRKDNRIENLEVLDASEHRRKHRICLQWSRFFKECIECNTRDRSHNAKGLCCLCYNRRIKQNV